MSSTSNRTVSTQFTGDVSFSLTAPAGVNTLSPAVSTIVALVQGANTITPPSGATAVTITKPSTNTATLTLKGVTGDTGLPLGLTDPDSISLAGTSTFVITAGAAVTLRLTWS